MRVAYPRGSFKPPDFQFRGVYAYCDSLGFFVRGIPFPGTRTEWQRALGRPVVFDVCKDQHDLVCGYVVTVHQPTERNLHVLDALQQHFKALLFRADIACDWTFATEEERRQFRLWLEGTLLLRWRRKGEMFHYVDDGDDDEDADTLYWTGIRGRKWPNRNLRLYDDLPCRAPSGEQHCVHLELCFFRAHTCRKQGMHKPTDVLRLDPRTLFAKHTKLMEGVERFKLKVIRDDIERDRQRHLRRKYHSEFQHYFMDKFCRITPRQITYALEKTGRLRAQWLKDKGTNWLRETIPFDVLEIPTRMITPLFGGRFSKYSMNSMNPPSDSTHSQPRRYPPFKATYAA
jgi:hypothetical protein